MSETARTYRRLFATYTNCVPSGEIATDGRPKSVNCCPSGNAYENRIVGAGGRDTLDHVMTIPTSVAGRIAARRNAIASRDRFDSVDDLVRVADNGKAACSSIENSATPIAEIRRLGSFSRQRRRS